MHTIAKYFNKKCENSQNIADVGWDLFSMKVKQHFINYLNENQIKFFTGGAKPTFGCEPAFRSSIFPSFTPFFGSK